MAIVNEYSDIAEAYLDKGFLESHGIPADVDADALSQIYPGIGGLGSIALVVPDDKLQQATRLLDSRPAK